MSDLIRKFKVLWLRNVLEAKMLYGRHDEEHSQIHQRMAAIYQKDYLCYDSQKKLGGTNAEESTH